MNATQYIGDKEILMSNILGDEKTPIGNELVQCTFVDGVVRKYPKTLFDRLVTDAPIDATELRTRWVDPIVNQTIVMMQESDIRMDDLTYFIDTLCQSIDHKSTQAITKMFDVSFYGQRTLLQIEEKIKGNDSTKQQPTE